MSEEKKQPRRLATKEELEKANRVRSAMESLAHCDKDTDPEYLVECLQNMAHACVDLAVWTERHRLYRIPSLPMKDFK